MKRLFQAIVGAFILCSVFSIAWSSGKAPPAVQAEFDAFFARFKAALKADDAAAVAALSKLPFQNDPAVSTAAQFRTKVYDEQLTKAARACLRRGKADYDRDPENRDTFYIFCGEPIFVFTRTPAGFRFTDISVND